MQLENVCYRNSMCSTLDLGGKTVVAGRRLCDSGSMSGGWLRVQRCLHGGTSENSSLFSTLE